MTRWIARLAAGRALARADRPSERRALVRADRPSELRALARAGCPSEPRALARVDRFPDHRAVFARFVEALAARSRAFGHPRIREV